MIEAGYASNGRAKQAINLFDQIIHKGFKPDDITFVSLLIGCSDGGLVSEGQQYFDSMERNYGIEPKREHYACMIDLLGRNGLLEEAYKMIFCTDSGELFMVDVHNSNGEFRVSECLYERMALLWVEDGYIVAIVEKEDGKVLKLKDGRNIEVCATQGVIQDYCGVQVDSKTTNGDCIVCDCLLVKIHPRAVRLCLPIDVAHFKDVHLASISYEPFKSEPCTKVALFSSLQCPKGMLLVAGSRLNLVEMFHRLNVQKLPLEGAPRKVLFHDGGQILIVLRTELNCDTCSSDICFVDSLSGSILSSYKLGRGETGKCMDLGIVNIIRIRTKGRVHILYLEHNENDGWQLRFADSFNVNRMVVALCSPEDSCLLVSTGYLVYLYGFQKMYRSWRSEITSMTVHWPTISVLGSCGRFTILDKNLGRGSFVDDLYEDLVADFTLLDYQTAVLTFDNGGLTVLHINLNLANLDPKTLNMSRPNQTPKLVFGNMAADDTTGSSVTSGSTAANETGWTDATPVLITGHKLNGHNYLQWRQSVYMFICGKGKDDYLTGAAKAPDQNTSAHKKWKAEDHMVMSWLVNSMTTEVGDNFLLYPTSHEIWEAAKEAYSTQEKSAEIYEVECILHNLKQGDMLVNQYFTSLNRCWQKLDLLETYAWSCTADALNFKKITEQKRLYKFLMGLTDSFEEVRSRILGRNTLPSLKEAFSEVRCEESRKKINHLSTTKSPLENSAMAARSNIPRSSKQCDHCHKKGHTKDTCWEIHGKPANWKPRPRANHADTTNNGETHAEPTLFSKDQLELLQKLFGKTTVSDPHTAHVAQSDLQPLYVTLSCAFGMAEVVTSIRKMHHLPLCRDEYELLEALQDSLAVHQSTAPIL
ncbi:Retrovirus-related Pol polyprotein from transposon RE1 [Senna tora]|uniref:Retrovirus-related Pol polyprotein from transposon RE1 n=1 Tax=Senna tora TaxID=362788 RepID=A0A834T5J0_9FABA|nr:Retrovirus-related Pol polyprotein from transposon RE1 [Senna tora]